jgi:hypothetical protein
MFSFICRGSGPPDIPSRASSSRADTPVRVKQQPQSTFRLVMLHQGSSGMRGLRKRSTEISAKWDSGPDVDSDVVQHI